MGKSGIIKPVLLLAFLGIISIALINPIAGVPMNQGNMTGQGNMMTCCPCGAMMHGMMGEQTGNGTMMMGDMMGGHSANETMMHCMMMNGYSANESNGTMIHCHCMMGEHAGNGMMMGNNSSNETMMPCMMMENNSANGTMMHCHCMMDQNNSMAQKRLDCASFWLKKAIEMHELHLNDPKEAANESSQIEMMNQMMKAYACLTGKNMTENMTMYTMTNTTVHVSGAH